VAPLRREADGEYELQAEALDLAGNTGAHTVGFTVRQ
jgi:hypothetical protein